MKLKSITQPKITKRTFTALLIFMFTLSSAVIIGLNVLPIVFGNNTAVAAVNTSLPLFTEDQLKVYDGTDPAKPIYLALDGSVYDVTAGKEFYQTGGDYHYLAGRDASTELHLAGGAIIKRKYPVVGNLAPR